MRLTLSTIAVVALVACQTDVPATTQSAPVGDQCGASQFSSLVGGPVSATRDLNIPGSSRYYGRTERIDPNVNLARLNFVVSTDNVVEALIAPDSTIVRVFCG